MTTLCEVLIIVGKRLLLSVYTDSVVRSKTDLLKSGLDRPRRVIPFGAKMWNRYILNNSINPEGENIIEEDWDNLVILDACRYDYFKECSNIQGNLDKKVSRGSVTSEFIRGNFMDKKLYDTIYLTTNAFYTKLKEEINSEVYKHVALIGDDRDAADGITTHPKTVTDKAIELHEQDPDKKLIIHYLQPHQPYIGEFGQKKFQPRGNLKQTAQQLDVSRQDIVRAYKENLLLALNEVERLLDEVSGKTVITADHGEMLGEQVLGLQLYGHFEGYYRKELVEVPWCIIDGERREINESTPETDRIHESVDEDLKALGYKI